MADMSFHDAIITRAKAYFGSPIIDIYASDTMLDSQIDVAFQKIRAIYYPRFMETVLAKQHLVLDTGKVASVIAVGPFLLKEQNTVIYDRSEFSLMEAQMYFQSKDYSLMSPVLAQTLMNQYRQVMNTKFDFKYNNSTGDLFIDSVPGGVGKITIIEKRYITSIEEIPKFAQDIFYEYCLAKFKQMEGRIRSKFADSIPGAPTDGQTLLQKGEEEEQQLEEKLNHLVALDVGLRW